MIVRQARRRERMSYRLPNANNTVQFSITPSSPAKEQLPGEIQAERRETQRQIFDICDTNSSFSTAGTATTQGQMEASQVSDPPPAYVLVQSQER
ncbi:hypothetical protein PM082_012545 [Marasmius tenuissimus]|nr:hypothetical protein PM082_012545 [Marasmius tenuissimus]